MLEKFNGNPPPQEEDKENKENPNLEEIFLSTKLGYVSSWDIQAFKQYLQGEDFEICEITPYGKDCIRILLKKQSTIDDLRKKLII